MVQLVLLLAAAPAWAIDTRECVRAASDPVAIASCEKDAQARARQSMTASLLWLGNRMPPEQVTLLTETQARWEAYFDLEQRLLAASAGQRSDGLGAPLREGLLTRLLEQRAATLKHLVVDVGRASPPAE